MAAIKEKRITEIRTDYVRTKQLSDLTKSRRRRKLFLRLAFFTLFMILTIGSMVSIINNQNANLAQKQNEKATLNKKLVKLKKESGTLQTQVKRLHNKDYIAEIARRDFLLSKPNETIFTTSNSDKH